MHTLIVDYGMGNLASVKRAVEECGGNALISDNPRELKNCSRAILPGVGSFALAQENLSKFGWSDEIQEFAINKKMPFLGICLGMQLLAGRGEEHGDTKGLNLIPGRITKLLETPETRIPHVGWNEIQVSRTNSLLEGIGNGTDFYFVHSYYFNADSEYDTLATTEYGMTFSSVVGRDNIYGVQFHPEKSGFPGFRILKNFLSLT